MDLMMPRLDGFEATKRIKRSRSAVKVLVVTSLSVDNGVRQEMYRCGADAFLGKRDHGDSAGSYDPLVAQS